jgi:hypothetical protein
MPKKANLIKWTISLALLAVATVTGLALAAGNNGQSQVQEVEALTAPKSEVTFASLVEQIPDESKLGFWYARQYRNGLAEEAAASKEEVTFASLVEQIPDESKLGFWYARQYSNGLVEEAAASKEEVTFASLVEQIPDESKLGFWYARQYRDGAIAP